MNWWVAFSPLWLVLFCSFTAVLALLFYRCRHRRDPMLYLQCSLVLLCLVCFFFLFFGIVAKVEDSSFSPSTWNITFIPAYVLVFLLDIGFIIVTVGSML